MAISSTSLYPICKAKPSGFHIFYWQKRFPDWEMMEEKEAIIPKSLWGLRPFGECQEELVFRHVSVIDPVDNLLRITLHDQLSNTLVPHPFDPLKNSPSSQMLCWARGLGRRKQLSS
nr:hypothetical protein Iba_chr06bCG17140 [Ipomoea batatas]